MHSLLLHKELRQIASEDGDEGHYRVEGYDEQHTHSGIGPVAELVLEIGWSPEEEEPPHSVSEDLSDDESLGLTVLEALHQRDFLFLLCLY